MFSCVYVHAYVYVCTQLCVHVGMRAQYNLWRRCLVVGMRMVSKHGQHKCRGIFHNLEASHARYQP
jgi:hypothetical protein